ncbi:MAG: toxin-antitoxin system YwqK family antitoxin [Myxococcota bacterium]
MIHLIQRSNSCALAVAVLTAIACKSPSASVQASQTDTPLGREQRETKFENGQRKEIFSVVKDKAGNYVKDGPYTAFHQSGQKAEEGSFRADRLDGHWQKWEDDGKLSTDLTYKNGQREGAFAVYAGGKPKQTGTYLHDQLSGPFKYLAFDGLVVAGTMTADAPSGTWSVTDTSGKLRARATFQDNKLTSVESFAEDGTLRPAPITNGCAEFAGYTLGKVRWADVVFNAFARTRSFPIDAGTNKFSQGRMLNLGSSIIEAPNIDRVTLIFDREDLLTALTASGTKQVGKDAYADAVKKLHATYAKKYSVASARLPFVGDQHTEYRNAGCNITIDAPHLDRNMNVVLHSADFVKLFDSAK